MTPTPPPVKKLKAHVFICTNERPPGHLRGCCKAKGAEELVQLFKQEVAKAGLSAEVRAQKAGCLDTCEYGPSVAVYPEGIWYGKIEAKDVAEIVESHLKQGKPVERLRIPGK
jgi:(2Fe-2S) ferredoxin